MESQAIEDALAAFRSSLQVDGYDLQLDRVDDGVAVLRVVALEGACAECLVPKPIMAGTIRKALGSLPEITSVRLSYPVDHAETGPRDGNTLKDPNVPPEDYNAAINAAITAGCTDGWPVVMCTDEAIDSMVAVTGRPAGEVLGHFTAGKPVTVRDVAIQALMAGCLPAYMPVVLGAYQVLLDPGLGTGEAIASSSGMIPFVVVNGPIRDQIALNSGGNIFSPGFRANASIGRAISLGLINLAGANAYSRATFGSAYQYVCVIAENEETSPWAPLHTEFGFKPSESTVMVMWILEPRQIIDHNSAQPEQMLRVLANTQSSLTHFVEPDVQAQPTEKLAVVLAQDAQDYLRAAGWNRRRSQEFLYQNTCRRVADARAVQLEESAFLPADLTDATSVRFYAAPEDFLIICAGGSGGDAQAASARVLRYGIRRLHEPAPEVAADLSPAGGLSTPAVLVNRYIERGFTDGLPIVVPTSAGLETMIASTGRNADDVVGKFPVVEAMASVKDVALNALMAGCLPEYMPIVLAAFEMLIEAGGESSSVGGPTPMFIVNGPIRQQIGLNSGSAVLGPGTRANAAIGRALRLSLMNIGRFRPGLLDKAVHGQAYKYTSVVAENGEDSQWDPLSVRLGYSPNDSTVTMFGAIRTPRLTSYEPSSRAEDILRVLADDLSLLHQYQDPFARAQPYVPRTSWLILLGGGPRHCLSQAGWTMPQIQEFLYESAKQELGALRACGFDWPGRFAPEQRDDEWIPLADGPDAVYIVSAGGDGPHSWCGSGGNPKVRKL